MLSGGFKLRTWNSNEKEVIKKINKFENEGLESNKNATVMEVNQTYKVRYTSAMFENDD